MRIQESRMQIIENQEENQDFAKTFWLIFKRKWWLVPICVAILLGLVHYRTRAPGIYKATAVLKTPTTSSSYRFDRFSSLSALLDTRTAYGGLSTEVSIIKGRELAERVIEKTGMGKKAEIPELDWRIMVLGMQARLKVNRKVMTNLIEITASSVSPDQAMEIANAVAIEYVDIYKRDRQGVWERLSEQLEGELEKVKRDMEESTQRLYDYSVKAGLTNAFSSLLGDTGSYGISDIPQNALALKASIEKMELELDIKKKSLGSANPEVTNLENQIEATRRKLRQAEEESSERYDKKLGLENLAAEVLFNRQLYTSLMSKQQEVKAAIIIQMQAPEIIEKALRPLWSTKPNRKSMFGMGAFVGIVMGLGLALFTEYFDGSMRTTGDVVKFTGLPVLGRIPRLGGVKNTSRNNVLITYNGTDPSRKPWIREFYKQSYRMFQLKIMATFGGNGEVIIPGHEGELEAIDNKNPNPRGLAVLVTSSVPGEGASMVATNLAISISQTGRKVLLVDTDYHRPTQHELLDSHIAAGLTDVLAGEAPWHEAVGKSSIDNLSVIAFGGKDEQIDPSAVLSSSKIEDFISLAQEEFDVVIFDSPPVVLAAESVAIGSKVNGVVLVIRANTTKKDVVLQAKGMIQDSGGNILGVVLNFAASERKDYKYYLRR